MTDDQALDPHCAGTQLALRLGPDDQRMSPTSSHGHDVASHGHDVTRSAAVVALGGVALIHLLELQGKLKEVPYLGVGYLALIVASVVAAGLLVHSNSRAGWLLAGAAAAATLVGFTLTRTVGLPRSTDDIGNWLEPMGLASLFVEAIVVFLAAYALAPAPAARLAIAEQPADDRRRVAGSVFADSQ